MNSLPAHNFSQFLKRFTKEYGSSFGSVARTYPVSSGVGFWEPSPWQGSKGRPPHCVAWGVPTSFFFRFAAAGEQKEREHAIISLYFRNEKRGLYYATLCTLR